MLRGVLLAGQRGSRAVPALRSSASLGGLRGIRRERGGRDDGDDTGSDFLARNAPRGTGRGAGTFHRFVSHHEETVVAAEEKTFKNFTKRRGGDRRFADVDEPVDEEDESALLDMGLPGLAKTDEQQEQQSQEMRKRDAMKGEDEGDTYFDWEDEDIFIRGLPEMDEKGRMTTDTILDGDDERMQFGKMLWRRILFQARDMDINPPFARSDTVPDAMQEFRAMQARGDALVGSKAEEVKRLNDAKTLAEIDRELARLIVAYKLDDDLIMREAEDYEEFSDGKDDDHPYSKYVLTGKESEKELERMVKELDEHEEQEEEKEFRRVLKDEYDEDMEYFTKQHLYDLKQTLGEIPETDIHDEGFEAFRDYADELLRSGGVITYTYTAADKTDRKMKLPFPLATKKLLKTSLDLDKKYVKLAEKAPVSAQVAKRRDKIDPEVYGAHAWLALAKNPSMGETEKIKFTETLMDKLRELQGDKPSSKGGAAPKQKQQA